MAAATQPPMKNNDLEKLRAIRASNPERRSQYVAEVNAKLVQYFDCAVRLIAQRHELEGAALIAHDAKIVKVVVQRRNFQAARRYIPQANATGTVMSHGSAHKLSPAMLEAAIKTCKPVLLPRPKFCTQRQCIQWAHKQLKFFEQTGRHDELELQHLLLVGRHRFLQRQARASLVARQATLRPAANDGGIMSVVNKRVAARMDKKRRLQERAARARMGKKAGRKVAEAEPQ